MLLVFSSTGGLPAGKKNTANTGRHKQATAVTCGWHPMQNQQDWISSCIQSCTNQQPGRIAASALVQLASHDEIATLILSLSVNSATGPPTIMHRTLAPTIVLLIRMA
jgi:hypothetical protein